MKTHPDPKVQNAIVKLNDALCEHERNTGVQSVMVIRQKDWKHRSANGKPFTGETEDSLPDNEVFNIFGIHPTEGFHASDR